eukprot:UN07134
MISLGSVVELNLTDEQESAMTKLEGALEAADPDFYGFIEYNTFLKVLKSNDIKLSAKNETFLMNALVLIEEGVDYYAFVRRIREEGMRSDKTLQQICESIAQEAIKTD